MKKIFVLCPTLTQPRFHKRVSQLAEIFDVNVSGFSRGLYEVNSFPERFTVNSLGKVRDGNYLQRVLVLLRAVLILRRMVKQANTDEQYFYTFGLDGLIIARLSGLKVGFYEIGDIRFKRSRGNIFSFLENFLSRYLEAVVVTSPGFISEVKKSGPDIDVLPFEVIENKLPPHLMRPKLNNAMDDVKGKIKIGVIGFLRYEKPLRKILSFVLEHKDRYELHCWGDGPCKVLFENHPSSNVAFYGSFKNPERLEDIYSRIDLNYTVYGGNPADEIGVRLALPNKLYESIFYYVPILCREATEVGRVAVGLGVGAMIAENDFDSTLLNIDRTKIQEMRRKCSEVIVSDLIDDGSVIIKSLLKNK